jgi:hypothetical protein
VVSLFPVALLVSASYAKRIPIDSPAVFEAMYLPVSFAYRLRLMFSPGIHSGPADTALSK